MIRVGVGLSSNRSALQAGRAAAQGALKQGEIKDCDMVFLFATLSYEARELLAVVRESTGRAPLLGCTVTSLSVGKQGQDASPAVAVVAFKSDELTWRTAAAPGAPDSWRSAGSGLGRLLDGPAREPGALWLFCDGLRFDWPEFRAGLSTVFGDEAGCPLVGLAAGSGAEMKRTLQFHGDEVLAGGAAVALMRGRASVATAAEPFGRAVGLPLAVTRVRGDRVLELDGKPALEALAEYLGTELLSRPLSALPWLALELSAVDGEGGPAVVRAIRDADPESGSIRVSSEVRAQTRVRLMLRDRDRLLAAPGRLGNRLAAGAPAHFAMFGGCAMGRAGLLLGDDRLELGAELQRVAGSGVPWLALNGYGVLSPVEGRSEIHNQSMALTVLR
jgi:hypothetical protein